jgi:glyoxylase-like metal-dependent hydrolase (beta-lactamase superfamily II)
MNLLLCVALLFGQTGVSVPHADVTSSYETVKVADGIWAFVSPEPKSALVSGNSIAIIGDDGVLVVDSGMIPSLTRRMIGEIKQKTDKPVRWVVNTHWHWDHNFGNFVYRDAYPNVAIISTPFTRASMADIDAKMLEIYRKRGAAMGKRLHDELDAHKNTDGSAMTPEQFEAQKALADDVDHAVPEVAAGRIELPDTTITDTLTLYLGKREVQIRFLGRANTAGDLIVYVPDSKALMTGDLLVGPIPFATGSYMADWISVMKKLDALDASVIVPGHGPVERDEKHLHQLTSLFESIYAQVQQAVNAGLSLEDTRKKVDIAKYEDELTAGNATRKANFDEYFLKPVVETTYKQLKGLPTSESPFEH